MDEYDKRLLNYIKVNRDKVILDIIKSMYFKYVRDFDETADMNVDTEALTFMQWIEEHRGYDLTFF